MLTLDQLKAMPAKTVFATGEIPNSPEGIYMTDTDEGRMLLWAAKRGGYHDWTIYIHWENMGIDFVINNGDKVTSEQNIKKLVPCEDAAFELYRF